MALTAKGIEKLPPGKHPDGQGLYCLVTKTGGRSWALRYERRGKERWHGLGPTHTFKPEEARQRARKAKQLLFDGIDPIDARKEQRAAQALEAAKTITFTDAAKQYFDQHQASWSSVKHAHQFWTSLEMYAFPVIGKLPVAAIDTGLILKIIEPIWKDQYQTASRVRGRIGSILDWATVRGFRAAGTNPAQWKGHLSEVLPAKGEFTKVTHHAALPYADVPAFLVQLSQEQGIAPRAFEFLILAVARTSEVLSARWSEFHFQNRIWAIPPDRMKARKEHRVPLTGTMIEILKELPREGGENGLVFISSKANAPLAKNTLSKLVGTMGANCTVHGFRSSFRTWAAESTAFPREIIEAALAHATGNAVELAYQRSDVIEKRRMLMEQWSAFVATPRRRTGTVTPIRKAGV